MTRDELEKLMYDSFIEKAIKKTKTEIMSNRYGFLRGIPKLLADDIYAIRFEYLNGYTKQEDLERIKYISGYSLSKMPKSRQVKNNEVYDKFTLYQNAFALAQERLKDL
ncbi:MAG: hypothetical protein ACI7YS_15265 [Flavobacterium sp.]